MQKDKSDRNVHVITFRLRPPLADAFRMRGMTYDCN